MGWSEAALGDICRVVSGATPKTGTPDFWGGDIPWLTPNDMSRDRSQTLNRGERSLTQSGYDSCSARLFPAGSVVVSSRAPVGYVAIAGREMCTNQGCKTAVPPDFIDSRYLYWYLVDAKPDLEARASGTTFKEISSKRFAETKLRWPDLQVQRRIVEILEDHLSRIDAASSQLARMEPRCIALEEAWLRNRLLPRDSEMSTVGRELIDARGGWSRSARHLVDPKSGHPYLKMNNITRRGNWDLSSVAHVVAGPADLAKYQVTPGDILFNSKNSGDLIGKTAVAGPEVEGATFNENIMRLRFRSHVIPAFAGLWFLGPHMRRAIRAAASASTNVAAVYRHHLVQMPMWVPDAERQRHLAREFAELRAGTRRLVDHQSTSALRASALRRAVLAAAFEGRLTGRRSDQGVIESLADAQR